MTGNKKRKYHRAVKAQKKRNKRNSKRKTVRAANLKKEDTKLKSFLKQYKKLLEEHKKKHVEGNCTEHGHEEENGIVDNEMPKLSTT